MGAAVRLTAACVRITDAGVRPLAIRYTAPIGRRRRRGADRANRVRIAAGEAGEARAALDIAVDSGYLAARPAAWDALDRVLALTWPWVAP